MLFLFVKTSILKTKRIFISRNMNDLDPNKMPNQRVDCNMDQFMTLIDLQGTIISLDLSNFKTDIYKKELNMNPKQNNGLLIDYYKCHIKANTTELKYKQKLSDYVHGNDMIHIHKHINDGNLFLLFWQTIGKL